MADRYVMAVDAGTGSVRAVIFDLTGNQLGCVQKEWFHKTDSRYPGSMNFDWTVNWDLARSCIAGVLEKTKISADRIAAVSTTCMREGIVLYDKDGKEIWACANVDARSDDEVKQLKKTYPDLEKTLYYETGQTFPLNAIPRILWIKNKQPEIYHAVAKIGMFNDWLVYKMSGRLIMEPSNGSTSGFFSLQTRTWDTSIAERCGLRSDIFPPVQECGTSAGTVSAAGARETGLLEGTPLIIGGGDAQLGTLGVGAVKADEAAVFGGSFWQYEYNTDSYKTSPKCDVRVNCFVHPELWQYEALAFKPGLVMRWYRDAFCQLEKEQAETAHTDVYALMDKKAAEIPAGCYGMLCAFSDIMNFIGWRHAAPTFTNFDLDPEKFNRYTFYRAILENTAFVTYGNMELVAQATGKFPKELTFGGGAAKSPLWTQIVADVSGLPVKVPAVKEATALGAAMLAAAGCGFYADLETAAEKMVKIEKVYYPDTGRHERYMELYKKWKKVYAAQLQLSDAAVTRYMWSAPGILL